MSSSNNFPAGSRYADCPTSTYKTASGGSIVYVCRRFVPPESRFSLLHEHTITEGDRLDNLAAHYLNDPLQFWQLCDANNAMRPAELTEKVGSVIRITLPEGILGYSDA